MSRCATQIYQATLGQQNNALAVGENNVIDLRLDFFPLKAFNRSDIDFVIEVTNIADDGLILHALHVIARDHMVVRSEEHTSELQSLMRISYAVFCLKKTI